MFNYRQPTAIFPTLYPNGTFWGCASRGLSPPNSNSGEICIHCTYPASFIILCLLVQKLSCWQTHELTNKETDSAKTSNTLCYATTLGN